MTPTRRIEGSFDVTRSVKWALVLPDGVPTSAGLPLVVFLHGQGETGERLEALLPALSGAPFARLFIDGPWPVEVRGEAPPRIGASWYSYVGDDPVFRQDLLLRASWLETLVRHAAAGAPINLASVGVFGYSQGGYLASVAALRHRAFWKALCVTSSRIKSEMLGDELHNLAQYPVLVIHGRADKAVSCERQLESADRLRAHGANVACEIHEGGHGIRRTAGPLVVDFFTRWLTPRE